MIKIEAHVLLEEFGTNTWLLYDDASLEAFLIDPAAPSKALLDRIRNLGLRVGHIIITHGHGDHIAGAAFFHKHLDAVLAIHASDAPMLADGSKNLSHYVGISLLCPVPGVLLADDQLLPLGEHQVRVIHTPGHTPGSICLHVDKYLISGDTLFEQSIGRTDLPGGSHRQIIASIKNKLFPLPDYVLVFPGHGPATSIGLEKKTNPFIP
jgi:glyoxylase-like metal-dependent hydrolase (beta-lactamase superfamily II)